MHGKRRNRVRLALHDGRISLDEIQDVEVSVGVMTHRRGEPVAARFNEFQGMETSSFFPPAFASGYWRLPVNQVVPHPVGGSIPLDVFEAMLQMDRAGTAIQAETAPIPELEREDIRSRADLENHAVAPRTVNGACGNKKVIMLPGGPEIDILFCAETALAGLSGSQLGRHLRPVDSFTQAEIDSSVGRRVQEVIALILRV